MPPELPPETAPETMHVLNVPVSPTLRAQWRAWLAPDRQPFFLTGPEVQALGLRAVPKAQPAFSDEERDTLALWNVSAAADQVVWLARAEWAALAPPLQRALLRAQVRHGRGNVPRRRDFVDLLPDLPAPLFLWETGHLTSAVLDRVVSAGGAGCQRGLVPEAIWQAASAPLPRVRDLAGTFPHGSAGNCFGAVLGAAGQVGAEHEWTQREPFETFLEERTRPGGKDDQPGTVLVWRRGGQAQHAAVTLGGGWAFHKPSQTWMTPRVVLPLGVIKRQFRERGQRISRYRLR